MHKKAPFDKVKNGAEVVCIDYVTSKDVAIKWGITDRRIVQYCNAGRIDGAVKMGNTWLIPKDAAKPEDKRYKNKLSN